MPPDHREPGEGAERTMFFVEAAGAVRIAELSHFPGEEVRPLTDTPPRVIGPSPGRWPPPPVCLTLAPRPGRLVVPPPFNANEGITFHMHTRRMSPTPFLMQHILGESLKRPVDRFG